MNTSDRRKWNNILIFICCALIIVLIITTYKKGEKKLSEIYPVTDISKIVFNSPTLSYQLYYKEDNWRLNKPFKHAAVTERIAQIIAIQESDIYKHIKNNSDEFGFTENRFVKLNKLKIYIGDKAINSEHRYIKINERIFLVKDTIYSILESSPSYWLGKQILSSDELLTSISIKDNLYKEADLANLADAWYDASADNLLYPADNYITPEQDDIPVTITFANNETLQFLMHKQRFLVNTTFNLAYELNAETAEKLLTP